MFYNGKAAASALETREKRPQELYYDAGHNVPIGARWSEMGDRPPLEEAFERIQDTGSWITIHQAQRDPAYAQVFYDCMREFEAQTGEDFKRMMRVEDALIFITSPNRTTTYHIDRECELPAPDQRIEDDPHVRPAGQGRRARDRAREVLGGGQERRQVQAELQERATPYRLVPGNGIHIPINDPHWLQNDNNVSISLSVNFTLKDSERANVYRANYFLRKAGMKPAPPFTSPLKDGIKNAMMMSSYVPARSAIRTIRKLRGAGDAHQLGWSTNFHSVILRRSRRLPHFARGGRGESLGWVRKCGDSSPSLRSRVRMTVYAKTSEAHQCRASQVFTAFFPVSSIDPLTLLHEDLESQGLSRTVPATGAASALPLKLTRRRKAGGGLHLSLYHRLPSAARVERRRGAAIRRLPRRERSPLTL